MKTFIAGHNGMVGQALVRRLSNEQLVLHSSKELDLTNQSAVSEFFQDERPEVVIVAAAKVGGILANNTYRWKMS